MIHAKQLRLARLLKGSISFVLLAVAIILACGCGYHPFPRRTASGPAHNLIVGPPLWSHSGKYILAEQEGEGRDSQIFCVGTSPGQAKLVAKDMVIDAWAWAPQRDQFCYISYDKRARRSLRVCDVKGRVLQKGDLSHDFMSSGLEWTQSGRIVVVDAKMDPNNPLGNSDTPGSQPCVIRVFSEKLNKQQEFALPFTLFDVQLNSQSANSIVAVAGDKYDRNIVSVDLNTGETEKITKFGNIAYGPGRWKFTKDGKLYFMGQVSGKYSMGNLYVYDTSSGKTREAVSNTGSGRPISRFDVYDNKAAVVTQKKLQVVDLTNSRVSELFNGPSSFIPAFSPDGQKIAIVRNYREMVILDPHGKATLIYSAK